MVTPWSNTIALPSLRQKLIDPRDDRSGYSLDRVSARKVFSLPDRKALLKSDMEYEVILMDTSKTPIQRPKKSNVNSIPGKRKDIP